jgi:hypothetical protein
MRAARAVTIGGPERLGIATIQLRSFCGAGCERAPWQERSPAQTVSAAMTSHAVPAGSVLAAVALWAAVYTALLPKHAPALPATVSVTVAKSVPDVQAVRRLPGSTRWVDLPRGEPKLSVLPATAEEPSATDLPDADQPRTDYRASRRRLDLTRRAALPNIRLERRFIPERVSPTRRARARMRFRQKHEPIQFSLATRSSS